MSNLLNYLQMSISVGVAWWSYKIFWPQFKKQKRIENIASLAYKALKIQTEVEELIKQLYFLEQSDHSTKKDFYNQRYFDIQFKLSFSIHHFKNILLVLSKNEDLKPNKGVSQLTEWIKKLEHIIDHKVLPGFGLVSIHLFKELDFLDSNSFKVRQFESLRLLLQEINQIH